MNPAQLTFGASPEGGATRGLAEPVPQWPLDGTGFMRRRSRLLRGSR